MKESFQERFLHTIWSRHDQFLADDLKLADGTAVVIQNPGVYNDFRGGPDFLGAEILIDGVLIQGDIELHREQKDWSRHEHDGDPKYAKVVLHVVLEREEDEAAPDLPTLILRDNLNFSRRDFWRELFEAHYARTPELPCFPKNLAIPVRKKAKVITQMATARLDELIGRYVAKSEIDLYDEVYARTLDALGFSENRTPFDELSRILPIDLLVDIREAEAETDLESIFEALYLGAAGLLSQPSAEYDEEVNEYLLDVNARWEALKVDYEIPNALTENDWTFFRIRPLNSPYRRVAAAARLAVAYFSYEDFSIANEIEEPKGRSFWHKHTSYTNTLTEPQALLGDERRRAIRLNVILPARIALAKLNGQKEPKDLRHEWMEYRSGSSARYVHVVSEELMESLPLTSTGDEQGALFLYRNYCSQVRCSECPIGQKVFAE